MVDDVEEWIGSIFEDARHRAKKDMARVAADLSLRNGLSNSRSTFAMADPYLSQGETALRRCLNGLPNRIETRGREWKAALETTDQALASYLDDGVDEVSSRLGNQFPDVASRHIADVRERLELILSEFRSGWTAPRARGWHERNPKSWALLLLGLGAIAGAILKVIADGLS